MRDPLLPLPAPLRSIRRAIVLAAILTAGAAVAPRVLTAQDDDDSTGMMAVRRDTAMAMRRGAETISSFGRFNVSRVNVALLPYGVRLDQLGSADRDRFVDVFSQLLPGERLSRYRLNPIQAKALAYLVLGTAERYRGDDAADDDAEADPRRGPPRVESRGASVVGETADHLRLTVASLRQVGGGRRLSHDRELEAMNSVVRDARQIALTTEDQRCDAASDSAEELVTLTREAREKVRTTTGSAWMAVGDDKLERMGELADDVETQLLRCAKRR